MIDFTDNSVLCVVFSVVALMGLGAGMTGALLGFVVAAFDTHPQR